MRRNLTTDPSLYLLNSAAPLKSTWTNIFHVNMDYWLSPEWDLNAYVPYIWNVDETLTGQRQSFQGIGDAGVGGMYKTRFLSRQNYYFPDVDLLASASIPSGQFSNSGDGSSFGIGTSVLALGGDLRWIFPWQLAEIYFGSVESIPLYANSAGYRFAPSFSADAGFVIHLLQGLRISGTLEYTHFGIDQRDGLALTKDPLQVVYGGPGIELLFNNFMSTSLEYSWPLLARIGSTDISPGNRLTVSANFLFGSLSFPYSKPSWVQKLAAPAAP